ncbi:MAG: homoserine kinase [Jiangellaceae bacterium]
MSPAVRVRVPATSANLGAGFDALGLALDLHDVVAARVGTGLNVSVSGCGADELPRDANHLVVRAMMATFDHLGEPLPGLDVRCENRLPHGCGLGSSAAAIVAGVLAARGLVADGHQRMNVPAVLALAARLEGHPDNVAPCVLGGLTIAWLSDGSAHAVRLDVHPDVRPVVCIPADSVSTQEARGLLPATVPHQDAAWNAARAALLVEALTRRPELLLDATEDRLHQQYRAPAMPETAELVADLRSCGLPAVVSGAGPSVLVLTTAERPGEVQAPPGWQVRGLAVDRRGAVVEPA